MAERAPTTPRHDMRVVLVDASEEVRLLFRGLLETRVGFVVVGEAPDVPRALTLAAEERPDLVILDAGLLGGHGEAAVTALSEHAAKVVVVFADASTDRAALHAAGAFLVVDRAAALGLANILAGADRDAGDQATLDLQQVVEVSCQCQREGCGGNIRFVSAARLLVMHGSAFGRCLRCGTRYQLVNSMTGVTPLDLESGPAAHKLLNRAATALDAVRAAQDQASRATGAELTRLLAVAERQADAVVEGLRELILGLPLGGLSPTEVPDPSRRGGVGEGGDAP